MYKSCFAVLAGNRFFLQSCLNVPKSTVLSQVQHQHRHHLWGEVLQALRDHDWLRAVDLISPLILADVSLLHAVG